jgi:hypothetical protein
MYRYHTAYRYTRAFWRFSRVAAALTPLERLTR